MRFLLIGSLISFVLLSLSFQLGQIWLGSPFSQTASQIVEKLVEKYPSITVAETPTGLILANKLTGISYSDLMFLKKFRGKLIDLIEDPDYSDDPDPSVIKNTIKTHLEAQFTEILPILKERYPDLNDQDLWYAFITLRVNGSFSLYSVRSYLPNDSYNRLTSHIGNCSDHATRTGTVLNFFQKRALWFTINTPAIPGHVVISTYDKLADTSYILDSTFNTLIIYRNSKGHLIKQWAQLTPEERASEISKVKIIQFPIYFRYADPGINSLDGNPLNARTLNMNRYKQPQSYKNWLANEFDKQIAFWKSIHSPHYPDYVWKLNPIVLRNGKEVPWEYSMKTSKHWKLFEDFR